MQKQYHTIRKSPRQSRRRRQRESILTYNIVTMQRNNNKSLVHQLSLLLLLALVNAVAASADIISSSSNADEATDTDETRLLKMSHSALRHERQRHAMIQALSNHHDSSNGDDSSSLFTCPQEQRSHYYIHEGFRSAIQRSLRMANFDPELIWEFVTVDTNDDSDNGEVYEGVDKWDLTYSQFLEQSLVHRIRELEDSLSQFLSAERDQPQLGDIAAETEDDNHNKEDTDDDLDAKTKFLEAFDKAHTDLHCYKYKNTPLDDPQGKFDNITSAYWKFFNIDPPPFKISKPSSLLSSSSSSSSNNVDYDYDYDYDYSPNKAFYETEGNVYFDFLTDDDKGNEHSETTTQQRQRRGMFAARDFQENELVYSFMSNGLFFLELSTFESFIRNTTLLPEHDACLLTQWSFAQKLSRPGRYYICSSLDAGAFLNSGQRFNVDRDDSRDLRYYATRWIEKGEEIVSPFE